MTVFFDRPVPRSDYTGSEVGLTHPTLPSFMKLADNGDIHIMVNDHTGIIISASKDTIFLVANTIKLLTNGEDGFKWNGLSFNHNATVYTEPPLVESKTASTNLYDSIGDYFQ